MSKQEKKLVSRVALFAPDTKAIQPHLPPVQEVICTIRPSWSKVGAYEMALPGGKIDSVDYDNLKQTEMLTDVEAGANAAARELWEELGIELAPTVLRYILESTNDSGWTTLLYAAFLQEKPALQVLPESAGTVWLDATAVAEGNIPLFAEHAYLVIQALESFGSRLNKT